MLGTTYINGAFVAADKACLPLMDAGFWLGINVFDVLSARQGYIFKLEAHVNRFYRSLHAVRIDIPPSREEFGHLIVETVRRSGLEDAYIQTIATRGPRMDRPIDQWPATLIINAVPYFEVVGPEIAARGLRIRISSVRNVPIQSVDAKIKTFNRLHSYLARLEAFDSGADDAIMLDLDGYVTEGRGANVFIVRNGQLFTPSEGLLEGITRETVFELAKEEGLAVCEVRLTPYDLYNADEVFYSTTAGGIMPIVEVDRRQIGTGLPGAITSRLREAYWATHVSGSTATPVYRQEPTAMTHGTS
ncbi:MAG: aminotransferase class IV [Thermomicrobiales bacterium]|nr:aminotransferase class IV [Thermomicrobiales bacterium]